MTAKLFSVGIRITSLILICGLVLAGLGCDGDEDNKSKVPSVPSGLGASNLTSTSFTLSWNSSTDDVAIAEYEVFRNGVSIGTTSDTSLSNTGLVKSTIYGMTVRAIDTDGNASAQSAKLNVSTNGNPSIINISVMKQIIRGFGGATVFQPTAPLNNDQLDQLFANGPGQLGLTLLRIRIAADANWRAIELANAQGAKARGAEILATPWSPPASMKTNASLISGSLKPDAYAEYATYLNDFANYMAANNASLYALSIQNEPDIVVTYESCDWNASEVRTFFKDYAAAITSTKVMSHESFQFRPGLLDPTLDDPAAAANMDIVGGHIYGGGLNRYTNAFDHGKEVWMTEHYTNSNTDGNIWAGAIGAMGVAKEIHDCMAVADFSAYIWWYVRRYYGPLHDATDVITKRGYVMGQYSKFIRPGYYRVDATATPQTDIFVSAYKGNGKTVIVAINQRDTPINQTFTIQNGTVTSVTPYRTSASENIKTLAPITLTSGEFSAPLPAQSITTFVSN
jgi:glucuronoarabinoxylan endo-1,4-beta-xylanase